VAGQLSLDGFLGQKMTIYSANPKNSDFEGPPRQATRNLHRKEVFHFQIRSLTPPQAAGNALAFAVQQCTVVAAISGPRILPYGAPEG